MSTKEAPQKWHVARMAEIAVGRPHSIVIGPFGSDLKTSDFVDRGVPVVFVRNVRPNEFKSEGHRFVSEQKAQQLAAHSVTSGDLVVTKMGLPPCVTAVYPAGIPNAIITADIIKLTPDHSKVDPRYVSHYLNSALAHSQIAKITFGVTRPKVTLTAFRSLEIPLPPLPEQTRIADILDKAEAIRRKRRQLECDTDTLYRSTFYDLFGDPLHNPKGWPIERLGAVAELDRGRSRHRPRDAAFLYGGPYPFVQTGDITNSNGFVQQFSQTYSTEGLAQSKIWPTGTLCITIAANIAKTAILTFDACFPDSVVGLVPSQHLKTEYVRYWFVAMEKAIDAAATQVAQKNINLQILRDLNIQIPPIELQNHFTAAILRLRTYRERLVHATDSSNDLFNSLVQLSFKGEL